ncbi:MAG TPA: TetR/AcrR family transcriptional regulator [Myxococcota bacterium]|nr:TetR/AcrR family transcriptional regulator [Myxococcota bacterium]
MSRGEILDAALACFTEHGYHETSIDAIAERAGLSKGAIYWHFAGKRELFLALVDRAQGPVEMLAQAVAEAPDWRSALRALFARIPDYIEEQLPFVKLGLEYIAQSARDPGIRARQERKQKTWNAVLHEQLARGVAAGELRAADAQDVAMVLGSIVAGLSLIRLTQPDLDLRSAWRAAEEILWRGLQK